MVRTRTRLSCDLDWMISSQIKEKDGLKEVVDELDARGR